MLTQLNSVVSFVRIFYIPEIQYLLSLRPGLSDTRPPGFPQASPVASLLHGCDLLEGRRGARGARRPLDAARAPEEQVQQQPLSPRVLLAVAQAVQQLRQLGRAGRLLRFGKFGEFLLKIV